MMLQAGFWMNIADFLVFLKVYFLVKIYPRFLEMMQTPFQNKELVWILAPLAVSVFLIQIYFGRYKNEELGWESAYGNTIVLTFVSVNLLKYIYDNYGHKIVYAVGTEPFYKTVLVFAIVLEALFLMFADFFHKMPKKLSFLLSSSIFINVTAFIAIIIVYSSVPIDQLTLLTSLLILVAASIFFAAFRWIIPPSDEAEIYLMQKRQARKDKLQRIEAKIHDKIVEIESKIKRKSLKRPPK